MTINSGNSTSGTSSSSTNRISGLASGMDTESLVKDLTATTQSKLDAAYQQKQTLEWKQEFYQEIATKLNDFNNKYFSSSSNIADTLRKLTSSSSNTNYVTAIAGNNALSGPIYIEDIQSLATAAKLKGSVTVSPEMWFNVDTTDLSSLSGAKMNITLNGVTKTVTFEDDAYNSSEDVASALQTLIDNAFGSGKVSVSGSDENLSFEAGTSKFSIGNTSKDTDSQALTILGFDETDVSSNRLSLSKTTLSDYLSIGADEELSFSINGETFTFEGSTYLSSVISNINSSNANVKMTYSDITDSFTITSTETGVGSQVDISDIDGSFLSTIMGSDYGTLTSGTDAVVSLSLDGSTDESSLITLTRSTNSFAVNGVTLSLNSIAAGTAKEKVTINTSVNAEEVSSTITSFVDDYNALLKAITDKLNEKVYKDYKPLTDAQKNELSSTEQEKWTNYAKSGILKNDSSLTQIYNQLRNIMYSNVSKLDGSGNIGIILSDIGITTGDYSELGKLKVDKDRLLSAINKDTDSVLKLFTQKSTIGFSMYNTEENRTKRTSESGIMYKLSDIISTNLYSIGDKKSQLISLIGNPSTQFKGTTTYSKKIKGMEDTIDKLKTKLEDQQDFYYKKFTSMETALNNLNSQAGWLSQGSQQ